VITLTISRDDVSPPSLPLTINDSGSGTYVLVSFEPGSRARNNAIARSRWIDGGQLVSSTTDVLTMDLVVRINAASTAALKDAADALDAALSQFGYTITEQITGAITSTVYTCMPANTSFPYDPVQFRAGTALFTASIPRQP
jgi:hypothetical protein